MNLSGMIKQMEQSALAIQSLASRVTAAQARWKSIEDEWSILEVINHLYDEEREDFRARLDLLLHHPGQTWPPISPESWVVERQYNMRDLQASLDDFLFERRASVRWLEGLGLPDWQAEYDHPLGKLTAGDLMAAWVAHDFLHLRQLAEMHYKYLAHHTQPFSPGYAGRW